MTTIATDIETTTTTTTQSEVKSKRTPTTGQSGPKLDLKKEKLNDKERQLVSVMVKDANPASIITLATTCFPDQTTAKSNSWVRNSLRRLARAGWVEKVGRGTYRLSSEGHARYSSDSSQAVVAG